MQLLKTGSISNLFAKAVDAVFHPKTASWADIEKKYAESGGHHHLKLVCPQCGNTQTCRCSEPKTVEHGICPDCLKGKTAGLKEEQAAIPYEFDKALQEFLMGKVNDFKEFKTLYEKCKQIIVNDPDLIRPIEEGGLGKGLPEIFNMATYVPYTGPSQTRQIRV